MCSAYTYVYGYDDAQCRFSLYTYRYLERRKAVPLATTSAKDEVVE